MTESTTTVLRLNVAGQESFLRVEFLDTLPLQTIGPHLHKDFQGGCWYQNVVQLGWSCARAIHDNKGVRQERHEGAWHVQTSRLIEADEPTLNAVLIACQRNRDELMKMPSY